MSLLFEQEIKSALGNLIGWTYDNNAIRKTYTFDTYMDGINFINRLADKAEENNHHPDMVVGWCRVDVAFTSHDQGGVTFACTEMAQATDAIL